MPNLLGHRDDAPHHISSNHTPLSTIIRTIISTLTCMSMVSNSTSDSECYLAV